MLPIKQIYHHYAKWEDVGMWYSITDKGQEYNKIQEAIKFTGDHKLYGSWMLKVVELWTFSCEHNLSNTSINRQAWIGHAAAYLAIQSPEELTRQAWWELTEEQRNLANKQADKAIKIWERNQRLKHTLKCGKSDVIQMEFPMTFP